MSSGYYDKWRKAGGPGPSRDSTRTDDAAFADLVDGQCDRVREMEARLRGCQGVIDSLVGRVGECETRTEAGQRLAQLTRQVTEQSFEESGEALSQLHARSRRQEDVIKKLIEEIDLLHADRAAAGGAGAAGAAAVPDAAALRRAVDEQVQAALRGLRAEVDERFEASAQETHNDVKRMVSQVTTAMADLHTDMTSLKEFVREEVRATRRHCDEQLKGVAAKAASATAAAAAASAAAQKQSETDRGDDEDEGGGEAFQSRVVSNMVALQQHCRKLDAQAAEHTLQLRSVEAAVPRLDEVDRRMLGLEKLKADFGEHMGVFKGHLQKQTKRAVDTATAIQQLIEMTDASRAAIGTEITGVKDWAMQCLQRLRKRTEGAMQDARLARDDVAELSSTLTRGQVSQDRHADVLRELLTQQAGKASILHDALDKKVKAKAAAAAAAAAAAPLQQRAAAAAADDEGGWEPADATRALHDHYAKAKTRAADAQRELSDCEPQAAAAASTTGREKRQHHHSQQQQQQQRRRGGSPGGRRAVRTTEGGAARRRDIAAHLQDLYSD